MASTTTAAATSLRDQLRAREDERLLEDARYIRDWTGAERDEEARRFLRHAMRKRTLGQLTDEQLRVLFSELEFALESFHPAANYEMTRLLG